MIESKILKELETLPDFLQIEVLHYIEFLQDRYVKNSLSSRSQTTNQETEQRHGYGSMAGQLIMSVDFDEPLEDLEEYM